MPDPPPTEVSWHLDEAVLLRQPPGRRSRATPGRCRIDAVDGPVRARDEWPTSQRDLGRALHTERGSLSGIVATLIRKGLVEQTPSGLRRRTRLTAFPALPRGSDQTDDESRSTARCQPLDNDASSPYEAGQHHALESAIAEGYVADEDQARIAVDLHGLSSTGSAGR